MSAEGGRGRRDAASSERSVAAPRAPRSRFLLLVIWLTGGCANGVELDPPALGDGAAEETRAVFAGHRLGERRERVAAAFSDDARYEAPRCTFSRLAPADGARRAFPLERCEHVVAADAPDRPTLLGRDVSALVAHYVDDRLARIDARLAAAGVPEGGAQGADEGEEGDEDGDALAARLERRLGTAATSPGASVRRWTLGDDVVVLAGADATRLSVLDGRALALLPGLAGDAEADVE